MSRAGARTGLQLPGHGDMQGFNSSSPACMHGGFGAEASCCSACLLNAAILFVPEFATSRGRKGSARLRSPCCGPLVVADTRRWRRLKTPKAGLAAKLKHALASSPWHQPDMLKVAGSTLAGCFEWGIAIHEARDEFGPMHALWDMPAKQCSSTNENLKMAPFARGGSCEKRKGRAHTGSRA